jgi:hypothetical protein
LTALLTSCAVGPNFKKPAAPPVKDYTPSPISTTSSATNVAGGEAQRFVTGQDIAGDWWTLFHSKPLNALIERSLKANPNLKAAQAALLAARENVKAQRGAYYPSVAGSFSAARQKTAADIAPVPNNNELYFNLYTPQVTVSYVPDVFGLNRRTVESLNAQAEQARFALVASDIALSANVVAAAIQEASLREQIEATHQLIDLNTNMLRISAHPVCQGYASRLDVAAQESQLAQIVATLPPLLKQLAQQRDLLAALSGGFPSEGPAEKFELSGLQLPQELPLSLPSQLVAAPGCAPSRRKHARRQRPGWDRRGQPAAQFHAERGCRLHGAGSRPDVLLRHGLLDPGRIGDATHFPRRHLAASAASRPGRLYQCRRTISRRRPDRLSERGRHLGGAGTGCRRPERRRRRQKTPPRSPWICPCNNGSPATPATWRC